MAGKSYLFTSESVSEGHPDKCSDQISDAVLDEHLRATNSPGSPAKPSLPPTGSSFRAKSPRRPESIIKGRVERNRGHRLGPEIGFDTSNCQVDVYVHHSPPTSRRASPRTGLFKEQGAGDQGMMFGYAVAETEDLMPMPIWYANRLVKLAECRKSGRSPSCGRFKSQVTVRYVDGKPAMVDAVVISTQHSPDVEYDTIRQAMIDAVIKKSFQRAS